MSNYTKPERPAGAPAWAYIGAEYINGTGQTLMWMEDDRCEYAGGTAECCTGDLKCEVRYMAWQEMNALGMWMIEQADIARDAQLKEAGYSDEDSAARGAAAQALEFTRQALDECE